MKFKKVPNNYMFSKYVREDGKYYIESVDGYVNGKLRNWFEVTDKDGNIVEKMKRLKDAKEKYANA